MLLACALQHQAPPTRIVSVTAYLLRLRWQGPGAVQGQREGGADVTTKPLSDLACGLILAFKLMADWILVCKRFCPSLPLSLSLALPVCV